VSDLAWADLGGGGPIFVLVHGYTGSSEDFAHVVGPLTEVRRVVLVDQLGHGNSARRDRYNLRMLSDALIEFIEFEIGEPVDLLGHSMGGRTALPVALERPDFVRSLILMDTWADPPERDGHAVHFAALLDQADDDAMQAVRTYVEPPSPEAALIEHRWGADWVKTHEDHNAHVDPLAVIHLGRDVFGPDISLLRDAVGLTMPTTVLRGEFDLALIGPSDRLVSHIPNADLVVIDGAYHSPQLTHPEAWQAAILHHLERAV